MKKKPYQRNAGEFEIRILPDGRVVMVAPDEDLMDMAKSLEPMNEQLSVKDKEQNVEIRNESES